MLRLEELIEECPCVPRPVLRVAGGRPQDELVERMRHGRVPKRRRRHLIVRVLVGDLHRLIAPERLLADEHLVHHDADGVDVAPGVRDPARDEFGGEVRDRAEQRLPAGGRRARGPGEAEVADLDPAVVGEQYVLGLQVAVDDAGLVGRDQTGEHRLHDVDRLLGSEAPVLAQQVAKGDALQVLHDEVGEARVLSLVEDVDHVGVREPGGAPRLLDEAVPEGLVVREMGVHDLDRDAALEAQIGREVDRGHAAAGDARADLIAPVDEAADQRISGRRGHGGSLC